MIYRILTKDDYIEHVENVDEVMIDGRYVILVDSSGTVLALFRTPKQVSKTRD